MTTPNNDPIDRLTKLAAQRTARTDRLHAAVVALFAKLRGIVPVGTHVTVGDVTVGLSRLRTNVGTDLCWYAFVGNDRCSDIENPVGFQGYLHGDFNCPVTGPSRNILVGVGRATPGIVAALVAKAEELDARLSAAQTATDNATTQVNATSGVPR